MANEALRQLLITPLQTLRLSKREAAVQVIVVVLSFRHLDLWGTQIAELKHIKRQRKALYLSHLCPAIQKTHKFIGKFSIITVTH